MCHEWMADFAAFYRAVGPRPSALYSLDRIDNNKGYAPGNVRWATIHQQHRNMRNTVMIAAFGRTLSTPEWSERSGLKRATIYHRLKAGWTPEDTVSRPVKH